MATSRKVLEKEYSVTVTMKRCKRGDRVYEYPRLEVTISDPVLWNYVNKTLRVHVIVFEEGEEKS